MKKKLALLFTIATIISSCSYVRVNGDEEAVIVKKPWLFGSGGVDNDAVQSGSEMIAWSTDYFIFKNSPVTIEEKFDDMMTDDNFPVDFSAFIKLQIVKGKSPELYQGWGMDWYVNNIKQVFNASVRDKASSYKMLDLVSNRDSLANIEKDIFNKMIRLIQDLKMPIEVKSVTIGRATPPAEMMEETKRTAAQNQGKLTQDSRAKAELARKQAEINKAIADKAYMEEMRMTTEQYLKLRALEIEKEKVELIRDKANVTVIFGEANPIIGTGR